MGSNPAPGTKLSVHATLRDYSKRLAQTPERVPSL